MRHTRMVTPGYAPLEQYSTEARVGPATDVYGLSATLYHALTGVMPPTAIDRINGAVLQPLKANFSAGLREAIEQGLSLQMSDRPADATAFAKLALQSNATLKTSRTLKPPPVNPTLQPDFWAYNPDFLAFLSIGFVLVGLWLILGWLPVIGFLEIVLIGVFQVTLAMLIAWGYTALLELPLRFWHRLKKPVSLLRRVFITGLAFLSAVFLIELFNPDGRPDLLLWFLIGTIFTYGLLLRAYRFPTRVTGFQIYHWWDGLWLVVISSLIVIFITESKL